MRKKVLLLAVLIFAAGMILTACGESGKGSSSSSDSGGKKEEKTSLTLGTGSVGGVYYPLGGEMATLWKKNIDVDGLDISSVESGASVENVAKIQSGDFQLGIAQNTTMFDVINKTGEFEGKDMDDVVVLGALYPEAIQVATMESAGVDSIADLKGKKIAVGPPGGATRAAAELVLKAYGIEDGDYEAFEEGFGDAKDKLQNGTIDASIEVVGIPSSSTDELQASTKEVKLLDIDGDALKEVTDNSDYEEYTVEADTYDWLDEPVQTATAMAILIGSKSEISDDLAYQLTKTLVENAGDMSIQQAELITKDDIMTGIQDLPIHPGSQKYFDEEGIGE
ncbi:TAXI family TRAP transporter solute-binding subunit [Lentibacillus daqui]|uniref:TAXI family TRAP transporter solute-binding subunit n=1 Tax=Lentibacillus daqui TaxID=2911514 RepID=UPI0022B0B632|nr:TAXI family TRAP transporter solute-binding subunit [Lentibacillus daqui]